MPGLPYRHAPGKGLVIFHLALHASLPLLGAVLIGCSWYALAPVIGSAAAYFANSLILCPACAYHHAGIRFCGCYPKSVFPYRHYLGKRWGTLDNIMGRSSVLLLTLGPPVAVLMDQGSVSGIISLLSWAVAAIYLISMFACPTCRQRDVCALGRLTIAGVRREGR